MRHHNDLIAKRAYAGNTTRFADRREFNHATPQKEIAH
jgi:hypothetical protein